MKLFTAFAALLSVASLCVSPAARAQDNLDNVLAEDAVAYLVAFRDTAIFKHSATIRLDYRLTDDIGIAAEVHKVGPGAFIAPIKNNIGFLGFSIRRVDRCRFEERYTNVAQSSSYTSSTNAPQRVLDFSHASFEIVPDQFDRWKLNVTGDGALCFGNVCVKQTAFSDITVTPG
jgi:hypothetical protein